MVLKIRQSKCQLVIKEWERPLKYEFRFSEADPTHFKVGDIVEIQMTIATVPLKKNRFKMINQLRTVALLDGSFTDASAKHVLQFFYQHDHIQLAATNRMKYINRPTTKVSVKRKIGYDSEDVEMREARNRMINMNMNDRV